MADYLIEHIRRHSRPLDIRPTGEQPRVEKIPGIRAVVFDIYGTLFLSGSGDISLAQSEDRSPALQGALETAGFVIKEPDSTWADTFLSTVERFREARKEEGIACPEVDIQAVWREFIQSARQAHWLTGQGDVPLAIVDHECRVNPCWPVPGLKETLSAIKERNIPMGIVSNAQFYTPLLFPALLGSPRRNLGFRESLEVWSYREGEGKPSLNLYRKLESLLLSEGIRPAETLYLGNDIRNDIGPAGEVGFRTVLFAGDQRSLRWRREDPLCRDVRPDCVITALEQILDILS